jgi:hypothetical protein
MEKQRVQDKQPAKRMSYNNIFAIAAVGGVDGRAQFVAQKARKPVCAAAVSNSIGLINAHNRILLILFICRKNYYSTPQS